MALLFPPLAAGQSGRSKRQVMASGNGWRLWLAIMAQSWQHCSNLSQGLNDGAIALLQLGFADSQGRQQVDDMAQGPQINTFG